MNLFIFKAFGLHSKSDSLQKSSTPEQSYQYFLKRIKKNFKCLKIALKKSSKLFGRSISWKNLKKNKCTSDIQLAGKIYSRCSILSNIQANLPTEIVYALID